MNGRTYAQIKTATWTDDDYRALPAAAKLLYVAMLSNPTLNGIGVGEWDRQEFIDYSPDMPGEVVDAALRLLIERRYVLVDWDRLKYLIRSYVRGNSHLLNNGKNAAGLANAYRSTFSRLIRHQVLHELGRMRAEEPSLRGWDQINTLFTEAKFDYKVAPLSTDVSGVVSGVVSPIESEIRSTDVSGVVSSLIPELSISTQYSLLNTQETPPPEDPQKPVAKATPAKAKKKVRTPVPAGFKPNTQHRTKCAELKLDADIEVEKFCDWHLAKGTKNLDWDAAFRSWIRKAAEFQAAQQVASSALAPRMSNAEDIQSPPDHLETDAEISAWLAADRKRRGV